MIKNSCPQSADFVPNDSTKVCFFNNPAISRRKEYAMFESKKAPAPVVEVGVVKTAMNVRKAQTCGTCGNARNNPGPSSLCWGRDRLTLIPGLTIRR